MPETKFESFIFSVIMTFIMVYAMICYNIAIGAGFDLHLKLTQDLRVKLTHPGDLALMPVTGFTSGNLR